MQRGNRCAAKQAVAAIEKCAPYSKYHLTDLFSCTFYALPSIWLDAKFLHGERINVFFSTLCNLLLHLHSEHIINLGQWDDGGQQHETEPSHSVLFNCLRRIHGSCFTAEDYERACVCEGKLPPPQKLPSFSRMPCPQNVHNVSSQVESLVKARQVLCQVTPRASPLQRYCSIRSL